MLTAANLFSGCIGITFAMNGDLTTATYLIWIAMVFDFFDGLAARALNVKSDVGLQLDSLADVVSFGVLPGFIIFQLMISQTKGKLF